MKDTLKTLIAEYDAVMAKLKEAVKPVLLEILENAKKSNVVAIRWVQYSPHFNDGDACTFSVHDVFVKLKDVKDDDGDYENGFTDVWRSPDLREIESAVHSIPEKILEDAFGNGYQITVSEDGISVEEYEHD